MDMQSPRDMSLTRHANSEISEVVSHQQILNYRQALERKLQQRNPREHLINQGIMPAASTSTAPSLLLQKTKLERAQTGDLLQKKIRVRPNRDQLIQRHILNDIPTAVDPSLLANQIKLKRKKLEDDLNERLTFRPGPLELVKENILEQGTPVGIAVQEGNVDFTDTANSSLLEPISPDSNDGSSPEPSPDTNLLSSPLPPTSFADLLNHSNLQAALSKLPKTIDDRVLDGQPGCRKERTRKKSPKQKFKKYKYHEYKPPNGEVQKCSLPMDSPYALMLQQQQLYLQLQVLYQNYPGFVNLPSIPENTTKQPNNNNIEVEKPVKIEDMRVVDMRKELKMRGLPVSGSKTDLIERLRASQSICDQNANSPDPSMSDTSSVGSPGVPVSSAASMSIGSPVAVTSPIPGLINTHVKLGRSCSLPAHEARVQQVQMQLMANCKKLQTQLPPEVQQQLHHLQYLNLQTHLQQHNVKPQSNSNQAQPIPFNTKKPGNLGSQQGTLSPIKKESSNSDSCIFSQQQQQQQQQPLFSTVPTSSGVFFSHPQIMDQAPKITMTQAMSTAKFNTTNMEQQQNIQNFVPGQAQPGFQGLMHLKAEVNRLNVVGSHSEPDLSHLENIDNHNNSSWTKGMKHTQDNKILSPPHRSPCQISPPHVSPCQISPHVSPCQTPIMFSPGVHQQQEQQPRQMDPATFNQVRMKPDQLPRSYSEHSSEESGRLIHNVSPDKQRSLSEPPHPFVHRRSCSLPSDQLFFDHVQPPPSYEAHMAAQIQRKLSQEYPYSQQQPGMSLKPDDMERKEPQMVVPQLQRKRGSQDYTYQQQQPVLIKTEDMDLCMDTAQCRELTKELQRAMMKQPDLGLDNDEILEILGASVGNSIGSPDHPSSQQIAMHSPVPRNQPSSPQRFVQNPHLQHMSPLPKSPSTGYLGVYNPPTNNNLPLQSRLSKSCEDMVAPYNALNAKQSLHLSTEDALADLDSIIMSPASPMRVDPDNDDHMMSISNNIPIPNGGSNKTDPLGWLDLNSPSNMTTSPNSTTEVTYMNRSSPPATLYGANEHLNLPFFELDNQGQSNFSHDFSEAMDFCV